MSAAINFQENTYNITNQSFFDFSAPIHLRKRVKQDILQEVILTLFKSRHKTIMKLINTDFSNLGKKTIYDFGDDEAVNELLKEHKSIRDEITKDFFDHADTLVRLNWMKDLSGMLQHVDPNAKEFFKAVDKEIDKYKKDRNKRAKEGWIAD
jgi:ribosomal protein S20